MLAKAKKELAAIGFFASPLATVALDGKNGKAVRRSACPG
jgi:hypothetical protein